jgi:tellurite resistance protein TehA-like permease
VLRWLLLLRCFTAYRQRVCLVLGGPGGRDQRAHRAGRLPFSPTRWSFTFPVGTVVIGTSGLAERTGSAVAALAVLSIASWAAVAMRTARGARRGSLLIVAPPA